MKRCDGFTLVELVTTLVLIGVLAVAAMPRLFNVRDFRDWGFYGQVRSDLAYAQKSAIAANCPVNFVTTAAGYSASFTAVGPGCAAVAVPSASGSGPLTGSVPGDATLSATTISFDGAGRRTSAANTITVSGRPLTIETTGFIH